MAKEVYIVAMARTPIGSFNGALSSLSAVELGSRVISEVLSRSGVEGKQIDEVFMGNVIQANTGQAPTKQAALAAGVSPSVPCTTVNKVCASGMKSIIWGAQSILLGDNDIVIAGGMESMSNAPYYIEKARNGYRYGNGEIVDGIVRDALQDPYNRNMMGHLAELCASKYTYSREEQDAYAIASYQRTAKAYENAWFDQEIIPLEIPQRKGALLIVKEDEEYKRINYDKVATIRPAFQKSGTVTAINASKINDGAAALMLVSGEKMKELGLKPIAKILSYADASQEPDWFTTTPARAIPKALKKAKIDIDKVDFFEINEAFSVVAMANIAELGLNKEKVNVFGGAVSMGHPVGVSGTRIVATLMSVLTHKKGHIGCAGICNGGGGASAMVIEKQT